MLDGLLGGDPQYDATQLPIDEPLVQPPESAPGILLRIRPFKENQGVVDGAGLLQSVHDVTTNFRGRTRATTTPSRSGSTREGQILHARRDRGGRRQVPPPRRQQLRQQRSVPRRRWSCLPVIDPDEYVAGAWLEMEKLPYYPIRHHNSDEWATDPYGEITSEMLSLDDSTVVTQVVFRPAKQSWTDGDRFKHNSVDDLAHALRQGTSVGWLDPQTRPASQKDKQAAKTIEQQRGQQAFHVNIRVLAASTDKNEAEARARGVAGMFRKYYNAMTEQGLDDTPVWHRKESKRASQLRQHVARMADREWTDRRMIMTVDELAGVAHIPNNEIETPNIDWRYTQRGDRVPADTDQYDDTAARHRSGDRSARQGGKDRV